MTHVDEIGVLGVHPARHLHRLLDGLVRVVRFVAQGTHHQRAHAAQFRPFAVGERGEIGHVGHIADAKPRNRQLAVHHTDGSDEGAGGSERTVD